VSYVMLANPTDFADGWALVYSSFAAGKFAIFTFAYAAAAVGILVGVIVRGRALLANRGSRLPSKA
jgi:quinol-cytochrome oxidoreductase complex cytochrome b subunit